MKFTYTSLFGFSSLPYWEGRVAHQLSGGEAATPAGLEGTPEERDAERKKNESLTNRVESLRTIANNRNFDDEHLKSDMEKGRTGEIGAMTRVVNGVIDFERFGEDYLHKGQFDLLQSTNATIRNPEDKILLGVLDGKLVVLGGDAEQMKRMLPRLHKMELQRPVDLNPLQYNRHLADAIQEYIDTVAPITDRAIQDIDSKGSISSADMDSIKANNAEWAKNFPNEYLRVLIHAIRKNPTLISRLENGRVDSAYVNDNEFHQLIQDLLADGLLDVIDGLTDEWKTAQPDFYHRAMVEAAKKNPAVLAKMTEEYEQHWQDAYPGASPETSYDFILKYIADPTGKNTEQREAIAAAIYDVSTEWLEENDANRDYYHQKYEEVAKRDPSTLSHLTRENRSLLNEYASGGDRGWANMVIEVVKHNADALEHLSTDLRDDLKTLMPDKYEDLKEHARSSTEASLLLDDADVFQELINENAGEALAKKLLNDPELINNIPPEILSDPKNRDAVIRMITGTEVDNLEPEVRVSLGLPPAEGEGPLPNITANPQLLRALPEEFRTNKDIAGTLVQRNANVFPFLSEELRGDEDIIYSALRAEENGLGNFHWMHVPEGIYADISKKLLGGDPSAQRFLPYMLDTNFEAEDESVPFSVIDSIPADQQTAENMAKLLDDFAKRPELITRIPENAAIKADTEGYTKFLLSVMNTNSAAVKYLTKTHTGLSWENIAKILEEQKWVTLPEFDDDFSGEEVKIFIDTLTDAKQRSRFFRAAPNVAIAEYLDANHTDLPENILQEMTTGKLKVVLEDPNCSESLKDPVLLRTILKEFPQLMESMTIHIMNSPAAFDALAADAADNPVLERAILRGSGEVIRNMTDPAQRIDAGSRYGNFVTDIVLRSPESTPLLALSDNEIMRNNSANIIAIVDSLEKRATDPGRPSYTPLTPEQLFSMRRSIVTSIPQDTFSEVLLARPELAQNAPTYVLESVLRNDAQKEGALILSLLPTSPEAIAYAGNNLSRPDFVEEAFNRMPNEKQQRVLITMANNPALIRVVLDDTPNEDLLRAIPGDRYESMSNYVGIDGNKTFVERAMIYSDDPTFILHAADSLRSDQGFIEGVLDQKDQSIDMERAFIHGVLMNIDESTRESILNASPDYKKIWENGGS